MKIRNKNENRVFADYLESAIDKTQQAIDSITYSSYPDMNKRTIAELEKAIDIIDKALNTCIFKP